MSDTKFTKGPLRLGRREHSIAIRGGALDDVLASVPLASPNALADAKLYAASPTMYAALEYARNLIGPDEVIDTALAKARGEA